MATRRYAAEDIEAFIRQTETILDSGRINEYNLNAFDKYGQNPLLLALTFHKNKLVERLIDTYPQLDLDIESPEGITPLMSAVLSENLEGLMLLLIHGATIDRRNRRGQLAVESLSVPLNSGQARMEKLLLFPLRNGPFILYQAEDQIVNLYYACHNGYLSYINYWFMQLGAEFTQQINIPDRRGNTCLHYALGKADNPKLGLRLIELGADPRITSVSGLTSMMMLVQREWVKTPKWKKYLMKHLWSFLGLSTDELDQCVVFIEGVNMDFANFLKTLSYPVESTMQDLILAATSLGTRPFSDQGDFRLYSLDYTESDKSRYYLQIHKLTGDKRIVIITRKSNVENLQKRFGIGSDQLSLGEIYQSHIVQRISLEKITPINSFNIRTDTLGCQIIP